MSRSGVRRKRLIFLRQGDERDACNEPTSEWKVIGRALAAVFYGAGSERRQAALEQGGQAATFVCPATETTRAIVVSDRIEHRGAVWNITAAVPVGRDIEFTATRAA